MDESLEDQPPEGNVEEAETDDGQAHDGAAAERDLQAAVERTHGRVGGAGGGVGGRAHADETGEAGEETARQEGERDPAVLDMEAIGQDGEQARKDDEYDDHDLVLLAEIGHRALADILGNLLHGRRPFAFLHHLVVEEPGEEQGDDRRRGYEIKQVFCHRYVFFDCLLNRAGPCCGGS